MKRTNKIRLTESQLHRVIKESVKRVLNETKNRKHKQINEGGNLYWHDENGTPHTNSRKTYRGVPETVFIWHGEWADPEIWYKNHEINANYVEEYMWNTYEEECDEEEKTPTQKGYEEWLLDVGTSWIQATLDEIIYSM